MRVRGSDRQMKEERLMSVFGLGQLGVELPESRVGYAVGEQGEALAASGFDDRRNEQAIHPPKRWRGADAFLKPLDVGVAEIATQGELPLFHHPQDPGQMAAFLARHLRHLNCKAR